MIAFWGSITNPDVDESPPKPSSFDLVPFLLFVYQDEDEEKKLIWNSDILTMIGCSFSYEIILFRLINIWVCQFQK